MESEIGWDWVGYGIGYDAEMGGRPRWNWMVDEMEVGMGQE